MLLRLRRQRLAPVDVLSPELVLVSPPEEAARARELLPQFVFPVRVAQPAPTRNAAMVFEAACFAGTIGPLLLAALAR
jgi:hypothetical protein